jgi:ABC-2 type transport system permease protein
MNNKIYTIIQHEYTSRVKTKSFLISTLLAPVGILLVIAVPMIMTLLSMEDTSKKVSVLDKSGEIAERLIAMDTDMYQPADKPEAELKADVLEGELDGYIIIPEDILESGNVDVYTKSGSNMGFTNALKDHLNLIVKNKRLVIAEVAPEIIQFLEKPLSVESHKITEKGTEEDFSQIYAGLGYILGFVIYILMFIYGAQVMRGVIEEKANRIVEVIASSARPFQIMMGKVLGIGLVGLTQVIAWIVLSAILLYAAGQILPSIAGDSQEVAQAMQQNAESMQGGMSSEMDFLSNFNIPTIPIGLILAFVFYFLSGYFIYSTLFAAVGSAVDQEQDAAQLQTPITIPIIIPILIIFPVMSNPDSTLAVVTSLIPLFSPILMIVRIAATEVPLWQGALSIVLQFLTFFGAMWMASKIYRVGILKYGKKPTFADLYKWLRTK